MDKKMDNVNFVSSSSISDNLNLHAKPMDTSIKNGMDARRDLGVHQKNGEDEQEGTGSIQPNSSSVQEKRAYFQKSQSTSKRSNLEGERGKNRYNNPMGRSLLLVHDQFPNNSTEDDKEKSQEISEASEKTFSSPRTNLPMDNYHGARSQLAAKNNQHLLLCNSTSERQLPSSPRSIRKCDSKTRILGVRELLGTECLDFFMPVETGSSNKISNNNSTQKGNNGTLRKSQSYSELAETLKNDHKLRDFHGPIDEWLIDQDNKEYINKTYGITKIYPLFVNRSGMTLLFLDERGILYHPEKICYIMKDTGELVPEMELNRRVEETIAKEKLEREKLAEKNREKRLAKKKRLAEEKKRLAEE